MTSSAFRLAVNDNRVATLQFDLPDSPVNIFNQNVLTELDQLVRHLSERNDIGCLVLLSAKPKVFIAGADVNGIAQVREAEEAEAAIREGQRIFSAWEALPFPTIAAIRGACVGGGLELALSSDYIVSSDRSDIRIGLPETKLGILPAWGGCTRLPRRVGVMAALDIILAGKTILPKKALKIGLLDGLFPDSAFDRLVYDFAAAHVDKPGQRRRSGGLAATLLEGNPVGRAVIFNKARKQTLATTKGHYPAPLRALEVIKTGLDKGVQAGFDAEAASAAELAVSPTSKHLIHLFQLIESAKKDPDDAPKARQVRSTAVLGAGVMGGGIAQLISSKKGIPVRLKDLALEPLGHAMDHAAKLFAKQVRRRWITKVDAKQKMNLIQPTTDYQGFAGVDLVLEAIVENLEIKQKVFAELANHVSRDAILASNTSSLSVDRIGEKVPNRERVVGMHFFNPVDKMPLVEVVAGQRSGARAVRTVVQLTRDLGKTPVVVQDGPGFLVNRLLMFYNLEALWLLDEGHKIEDLDQAMTDWGMPMGPLQLTDEVGWDVASKVAHILHQAFGDRIQLPGWLEGMAHGDRLGKKTGNGFYLHSGSKGKDLKVDEEVYELLGITPRVSQPNLLALAERMVLPMVNEAARCLEEKIVASPGDLDLAMIMGTGFPPFRGGLCRWADSQGLSRLRGRLALLAEEVSPRFSPSEAFLRYVERGSFYHYDA